MLGWVPENSFDDHSFKFADCSFFDSQLAYCPDCLLLNPIDVMSPFWKREWMETMANMCPTHDAPLHRIWMALLRKCGNFDQVLRVVSLREASVRLRLRR